MFGLGNNKDEERMWNFILFKVPMTDKEMEEGVSWPLAIIFLLGIVALLGWALFQLFS